MAIWSFVIGMESNQISKVNNDTARRRYMLVDAKESQKQNGMPQRHAINATWTVMVKKTRIKLTEPAISNAIEKGLRNQRSKAIGKQIENI